MLVKHLIKQLIPGVVWQSKAVNILLRFIDPVDYAVRKYRGLDHLPQYSMRVRSNGFSKQFGGVKFDKYGKFLARTLAAQAGLNRDSKVLEIGCGCGRTAHALVGMLNDGRYTGMDIETISLDACIENKRLAQKNFRFDHLDIYNGEYNPQGQLSADSYSFPYKNGSYDVIFLVSVFTHMLTGDVRHYISEIGRMLKPGGVCMVTTFLMDRGKESSNLSFPLCTDQHHYYNESMPEVAVGYYLDFYTEEFRSTNMLMTREPLWGKWRTAATDDSEPAFSQDIILFTKQ